MLSLVYMSVIVAGMKKEAEGEQPTGQEKEKCGICSPGDFLQFCALETA
jgi:hypothetical protein